MDCKTDWPDIIDLGKDITAPHLIESLQDQFCHTAVPDLLWSDDGQQFTLSKLINFLMTWGVAYQISSPHYLQSNGKAEATVKSIKKKTSHLPGQAAMSTGGNLIVRHCSIATSHPENMAFLQHRKLFGHPMQDHLPAHRCSFTQEWQRASEQSDEVWESSQMETERVYNEHAYPLKDLHIGSQVAIQHPRSKPWDIYGTIITVGHIDATSSK